MQEGEGDARGGGGEGEGILIYVSGYCLVVVRLVAQWYAGFDPELVS